MKSPTRLWVYTLKSLVTYTLGATGVVLLLLVGGQIFKIANAINGTTLSADFILVVSKALIVLLEAALPLGALISSGLVFGRLRRDGAHIGLATMGLSPGQIIAPVLPAAMGVSILTIWLATGPVPRAVEQLGGHLEDIALKTATRTEGKFELGPATILTEKISKSAWRHWMQLDYDGGQPDTLISGKNLVVDRVKQHWNISLENAWIWAGPSRIQVGQLKWTLPASNGLKALAMLGPPNSLESHRLSDQDPHHIFTFNRRIALACMAPVWGLLVALFALNLTPSLVIVLSSATVALSYWILRSGELAARAGDFSPTLAAWLPFITILGLLGFTWHTYHR